mgnify:FL=1
MSGDQVACPFCGKSRRLDLCDLGTGESDIECEGCENTYYVYIDYISDVTVSEKSCHKMEGK